MSVSQTFDDLYALFNDTSKWTLSGITFPARVFEDPTETIDLIDFPALVLAYDWNYDHQLQYHADSRSHHKYGIAIYMFLGGPSTPLEELHQRARLSWPYQIFKILAGSITLGGDIEFLGSGENEVFLPYRVGFWPWGGGQRYWGYRFTLIANEEGIETYAA